MALGASPEKAAAVLGITGRSYRNWCARLEQGKELEDGRLDRGDYKPSFALSKEEQDALVARFCRPDVADLSLPQAHTRLLDNQEYYGSLSTVYRVMRKRGLNTRRTTTRTPTRRYKPTSYEATGPNQVWSWDITYMRNKATGEFMYGYVIIDIYSRYIIHAEVHERDCAELAQEFLAKAFRKYEIQPRRLVLHSDNGASMKAKEILALLENWGVEFSHSRPRVSNDNPYSESLFRTLKHTGRGYPKKGFKSILAARVWLEGFVKTYNHNNYHSGINWVTPASRFKGEDAAVLAARKAVLEAARAKNPRRWINGRVRDYTPAPSQFLNPDKPNAQAKA